MEANSKHFQLQVDVIYTLLGNPALGESKECLVV
jgi:hypothetical protein